MPAAQPTTPTTVRSDASALRRQEEAVRVIRGIESMRSERGFNWHFDHEEGVRAVEELTALSRSGHRVPGPIIDDLLDIARHRAHTPYPRFPERDRRVLATKALLSMGPEVTRDVLEELVLLVRSLQIASHHEAELYRLALEHPSCDLGVAQACCTARPKTLGEFSFTLLERAEWREHEPIRCALARCAPIEDLLPMLAKATPQQFRAWFREVSEMMRHHVALGAARLLPKKAATALHPNDLLLALEHPDREVREAATTLLGTLRPAGMDPSG